MTSSKDDERAKPRTPGERTEPAVRSEKYPSFDPVARSVSDLMRDRTLIAFDAMDRVRRDLALLSRGLRSPMEEFARQLSALKSPSFREVADLGLRLPTAEIAKQLEALRSPLIPSFAELQARSPITEIAKQLEALRGPSIPSFAELQMRSPMAEIAKQIEALRSPSISSLVELHVRSPMAQIARAAARPLVPGFAETARLFATARFETLLRAEHSAIFRSPSIGAFESAVALTVNFNDTVARALQQSQKTVKDFSTLVDHLAKGFAVEDLLVEEVSFESGGSIIAIGEDRVDRNAVEDAISALLQATFEGAAEILKRLGPSLQKLLWKIFEVTLHVALTLAAEHYLAPHLVPGTELIQASRFADERFQERGSDLGLTRGEARGLLKNYCQARTAHDQLRVVIGERVRLRIRPTTSSAITTLLPRGTIVGVIAKKKKWTQVELYAGDDVGFLEGWVFNKYLDRARCGA